MIVDGATLSVLSEDEYLMENFAEMALKCKSVICCRVSPLQKSEIVKSVMNTTQLKTLSIGDGANDVPMLIEAHIGVGIAGNEGLQAVSCSDFAICKFAFLQSLLLTHGRQNYRRLSYFIIYYFYKNLILVFAEVYFSYNSAFSGMPFFPSSLPTFYNALWTSWPCLFAFSLDRDRQVKSVKEEVVLYGAGQTDYYFNMKTFWAYMANAFLHGTIAFFGIMLVADGFLAVEGKTLDHWSKSLLVFSVLVFVSLIKLLIMTESWNWITSFYLK